MFPQYGKSVNYLLELVRGKPKDDILGLPHTEDGYKEAKRILEQTYGKDIKEHKALTKELEADKKGKTLYQANVWNHEGGCRGLTRHCTVACS